MARPITSLEGFVRKIAKLASEKRHQNLLFRGHSKQDYRLKPSVFRTKNLLQSEHLMMRQLLASHPSEFQQDSTNFDRLVRAQHYGLPTRLLDVSSNPLVALYFASATNPGTNGQVVVLKPEISKQKYFDSDTVSCMSALSLLKNNEKKEVRDQLKKIWNSSLDVSKGASQALTKEFNEKIVEEFNELDVIKKLLQLVRVEKPDFRPVLLPMDLIKIVSVVPKKTHPRISAQSGAFLLFGLGSEPNDLNMPDVAIERFNISGPSKTKILDELRSVGISEDSLFPEIEKSANQISRRYS